MRPSSIGERDPVAALPPLRDILRQGAVSARKALGQNFLLDLNVTRRIARAAGPLDGIRVLEVGPGPGGLTRALLLEGVSHVTTLERDRRFEPGLSAIEAASAGRMTALYGDALSIDYPLFAEDQHVARVVANLPYNIATTLLTRWLTEAAWPPWYDRLVVLIQREVAERFVAERGSAAYGRLSVLAQHQAQTRILFTLPPSVFTPSPKVFSALLEIVPKRLPEPRFPIALLESVTAAAFGKRRKMLRSSLAALGVNVGALLAATEIDGQLRAEDLSVEQFARLAMHLHKCCDRAAPTR